MNEQEKRIFTLGMDKDSTPHLLEQGSYRNALNCRIGISDSSTDGGVENVRGNLQSTFCPMPADSTCIGKYDDKPKGRTFFFIYNVLGDHRIAMYDPDLPAGDDLGQVTVIARGAALAFLPNSLITARLVENYLFWTDGVNPPRYIDILKGNNLDKASQVRVLFDKVDGTNNVFVNGQTVSYTIRSTDGTVVGGPFLFLTFDGSTQNNPAAALDAIIAAWPDADYQVTKCGDCELEIIRDTANGDCEGVLEYVEITSAGGSQIVSVPFNFYPDTLTENHIALARLAPACQPTANFEATASFERNLVDDSVFYFQYRYVYDDGTKSTFSPISAIDIPLFSCGGERNNTQNCIDIDFTDPNLMDLSFLHAIDRVEIVFKEGQDGEWRIAKDLPRCEFGLARQFFKFYNEGLFPPIDQTDQARLFDAVPLRSRALEAVTPHNKPGGSMLFLGKNREGYDTPCIEGGISLRQTPNPGTCGTYTVQFRLRIWTDFTNASLEHQAVHHNGNAEYPVFGGIGADLVVTDNFIQDVGTRFEQILPEQGFIGYLAGTDLFAISTQDTNGNVTDYFDEDKGIFNSSTLNNRDDIRDAMQDNGGAGVYQNFEISGVPPGTYVIRIASHWVSRGDILGKGPMYDLDNGIRWQETSTYVYAATADGAGGGTALTEGKKEIIINLPFVPAGTNPTVDAGDFQMRDLSNPGENTLGGTHNVLSGYLIDGEGTYDLEKLQRGERVEEQYYQSPAAAPTDGNAFTDHNGFYFSAISNNIVAARFTDGTTLAGNIIAERHLSGGLGELEDGSISLNPVQAFGAIGTRGYNDSITFIQDNDYHECERLIIRGLVVDQDGQAVPGVVVAYSGVGRVVQTDRFGEYRILTYQKRGTNGADGQLILGNTGACCINFNGNDQTPYIINNIACGGNHNIDTPFVVPNLAIIILDRKNEPHWKRGDRVDFGIVYYDAANRSSFVALDGLSGLEVRVPYWTEDNFDGHYLFDWEIRSKPPIWATHYQWVRTDSRVYSDYLQIFVNDVLYVRDYDFETEEPDVATFSSSQAKEIYLSTESIVFYSQDNAASNLGYTFRQGDRLRLIRNSEGAFYSNFIDVPIRAQRGNYIVIEMINSIGELLPGTLIEIYTPAQRAEDEIYYEFSQCFDVINTGDPINIAHVGPTQTQTSVLPATGTFTGGNTYVRSRLMRVDDKAKIATGPVEANNLSDFFPSTAQSIGRPNFVNRDQGQEDRFSAFRFSSVFREASRYNGLTRFDGLNEQVLPREYGDINALIFNQNVLIAIQESETVSIYIGESLLRDAGDQAVVAVADAVVGHWNTLEGGFGTKHPESVAVLDSKIYYFDVTKGDVIRYSNDGLTPIGSMYGMNRYFTDRAEELRGEFSKVFGIVDEEFREYIITTDTGVVGERQTVAFSIRNSRWSSFYSYLPEMMASPRHNVLISWVDGQLWVHNVNTLYNNFYGSQYDSELEVVFNHEPSTSKVYNHTRVEAFYQNRALGIWEVPNITCYGPDGLLQTSNLVQEDFKVINGFDQAGYWRDVGSPGGLLNGERLRGVYLISRYRNSNTALVQTFAINNASTTILRSVQG